MAAVIATADPAARLSLRRHPVILAVILSDLLVRALAIANEAGLTPALAPDLNRDLARTADLTTAVGPRIDFARARAHALDLTPARARVHDFDPALALARELALDLTGIADRALDLTGTTFRDRALARDLTRNIGLVVDLARDLALAHDPALAHDRDLAVGLAVDLARNLAYRVALMAGGPLGVRQVEGLAAALLDGVLDDFTHADLAHADLAGLDLTGVCWSASGTQWPPGTDIDALRARSRAVTPSTGIYVITSPDSGSNDRYYRSHKVTGPAAQLIAGMPTDQAVTELLALTRHDAARIIKRCDEVRAGNLLSAIAAPGEPLAEERDARERAETAWKILQMLPPDRHGPLLDHMSSIALAAVLAWPPAAETVRVIDRADTATVVAALSEMTPVCAASLVMAMDAGRATEVLRRAAPARVADILRNISPASRRQDMLNRLPERFRVSMRRLPQRVIRHVPLPQRVQPGRESALRRESRKTTGKLPYSGHISAGTPRSRGIYLGFRRTQGSILPTEAE